MDKENNSYKSGIIGKAQACFGGKIYIDIIKARTEKNVYGIALSEFYQQGEVGTPSKCQETHDPQMLLFFDNIKSVEMMEDALRQVREQLKRAAEAEFTKQKQSAAKETSNQK